MKLYIRAAIFNILDEDANTQLDIASNPNTDSDVLAELTSSSFDAVARAAVRNPNADIATINTFIDNMDPYDSKDTSTLCVIMQNPNLDEATYDRLAKFSVDHPFSYTAMKLVINPELPASALRILLDYDTHAHAVMDPLIKHPNVTLDILRDLLIKDAGYCGYMRNILDTYHVPEEFLWEFAHNGVDYDKREIANTKYVPSEILEYLIENAADAQHGFVRAEAIENPNLSVEVLYQLAKDPNNLSYVIRNPNCPADILSSAADKCIASEHYYNLQDIAHHPNTPIDVLYGMFEVVGKKIYASLALNPNIPSDLAKQIATRGSDSDIRNLVRNPNVDPKILGSLVNHNVEIRKLLARNPNTPAVSLMKLAKDRSKYVAMEVCSNPNLPEEVFVFLMGRFPYYYALERQLDRFPQYRGRFRG